MTNGVRARDVYYQPDQRYTAFKRGGGAREPRTPKIIRRLALNAAGIRSQDIAESAEVLIGVEFSGVKVPLG